MNRLSIYSPFKNAIKSDYPTSPYLHLAVDNHSTTKDGVILLSPRLMAPIEIDETIEQIKNELDEFGIKAKKEIKQLKEKMRKT
tara:strand:+ start:52598 stop:52849 length:252 start_codon:yes stop_codon:yes gene_type:complete